MLVFVCTFASEHLWNPLHSLLQPLTGSQICSSEEQCHLLSAAWEVTQVQCAHQKQQYEYINRTQISGISTITWSTVQVLKEIMFLHIKKIES